MVELYLVLGYDTEYASDQLHAHYVGNRVDGPVCHRFLLLSQDLPQGP